MHDKCEFHPQNIVLMSVFADSRLLLNQQQHVEFVSLDCKKKTIALKYKIRFSMTITVDVACASLELLQLNVSEQGVTWKSLTMARRYNVVPIIYTEILGFRGANRTGTCDDLRGCYNATCHYSYYTIHIQHEQYSLSMGENN